MGKGFRVHDTLGSVDFRAEFEGALRRKVSTGRIGGRAADGVK